MKLTAISPFITSATPRLRGAPAPGLGLFLFLFGLYVLTMSGHTYSSDEESMLAVAESLVASSSFAIPSYLNSTSGVDGLSYSHSGPAQSVVAVPLVLAGRALATGDPAATGLIVRIMVLLLPAVLTAATGLVLYSWIKALGYSGRIALLVGLLYGITSLAWPSGRTFFAEPMATFFLVLAAYGLCRHERCWWTIAGVALAAALATKFQTALAFPLIGAYGVLVCWRSSLREVPRQLLARTAYGLLGLSLPLGLLLLYHTRLFGGPFNTGYGFVGTTQVGDILTGSWRDGLYGLTISTGKGLLVFSPTILLGLVGIAFRLRQQWRESFLALAMLVVHLAFYSRLSYWHGDGSWGPRYMLFAVPFLYLPTAGLFAVLAQRRGRLAPSLVGGLATVSILIQFLPIVVNFDTYLQISQEDARHFEPSASPIVGHLRIWGDRLPEWWSKIFPTAGTLVLRDGFSYSEGDRSKGELLPRWTHADARIGLHPPSDGPMEGRLVVADHRPWPLPRAQFELLVNGKPVEGVQRVDASGKGIEWELRFQLTPEQAQSGTELDLRSDTWNPNKVTKDNPRNENLGLLLETLELTQGKQSLTIRDGLSIPPPASSRQLLWLWYQDTPNHHLLDTWFWYISVAGLPLRTTALLLVIVGLPAMLFFISGLLGMNAALRQGRNPSPASTPTETTAFKGAPGYVP